MMTSFEVSIFGKSPFHERLFSSLFKPPALWQRGRRTFSRSLLDFMFHDVRFVVSSEPSNVFVLRSSASWWIRATKHRLMIRQSTSTSVSTVSASPVARITERCVGQARGPQFCRHGGRKFLAFCGYSKGLRTRMHWIYPKMWSTRVANGFVDKRIAYSTMNSWKNDEQLLSLAAVGYCWLLLVAVWVFRSFLRVFTQSCQREIQRVLGELVTTPRMSFGPY